jgi:hypothetical protein
MRLLRKGLMSEISAGEIGEPKREIIAPDPRPIEKPLEKPLEKPQPDSVPVPEKALALVAHVVF